MSIHYHYMSPHVWHMSLTKYGQKLCRLMYDSLPSLRGDVPMPTDPCGQHCFKGNDRAWGLEETVVILDLIYSVSQSWYFLRLEDTAIYFKLFHVYWPFMNGSEFLYPLWKICFFQNYIRYTKYVVDNLDIWDMIIQCRYWHDLCVVNNIATYSPWGRKLNRLLRSDLVRVVFQEAPQSLSLHPGYLPKKDMWHIKCIQ